MSDTASAPYAPGAIIGGKYRLIRPLESGGMGTVWIAHHSDLDSTLAIKLVREGLQTTELADRLLREAQLVAKLDHPAIVRVHDCGWTEQGDPFIAMELLHGECLADEIHRVGRLSPARALQLLLPVADALHVAHEAGIVHRDLKPENIFVAKLSSGRVQPKVLDFGIARIDAPSSQRVTTTGMLLGSPAHMSPEQARGRNDVDRRADVWAFCVVLYEALTGRPPFRGENYNATLRSIIEEEPVPTSDLAAGDAILWSIIERGLAKDTSWRWSSMRELGAALAQWLVNNGVTEDATHSSLRAGWLSPAADDARFSAPPVAVPTSDAPSSRPSALSPAPIDATHGRASAPTLGSRALTTGGHGAVSITRASKRGPVRWTLAALIAIGALGAALSWWATARRAQLPKAAATPPASANPSPAQPPASAPEPIDRTSTVEPTPVQKTPNPPATSRPTAGPPPDQARDRKRDVTPKKAPPPPPRRAAPARPRTNSPEPAETEKPRFRPRTL